MAVLSVRNLTKSYGGRPPALKGVTFEVPEGVTGLLGPNGAGKSTLLQCVLGLLRGFSGEVSVLGVDARRKPREARRRVGFMPETDAWIPQMTGVRAVAYLGRLSGLPAAEALRRAHDVLHHVGLGEAVYREVVEYSTGMRQRFKLAQALVHDPDLLFLDEPTSGLDPAGRDDMLGLIDDLAGRHEKHVVWSSHVLPEVQRSADQVVVLQQGQFRGLVRIEELAPRRGRFLLEAEPGAAGTLEPFAAALAACGVGVSPHAADEQHARRTFTLEAPVVDADEAPVRVLAAAAAHGARVRRLEPVSESLEDVFMRLLGPTEPTP
jgi:ABC-2 type transport system ATP-binding protein